MIPIWCWRRVFKKLDRPCPSLYDVAHQETIFAKTVIKLRVDRKIQTGTIGLVLALDIVELL